MGIFTGATLHEVAHTVGAGNAMGKEISDVAIIVKMIRVMMLVPVLLITSFMVSQPAIKAGEQNGSMKKVSIPWFAIGFLLSSVSILSICCRNLTAFINNVDTFLLTMAMTALGAETSIDKFRKAEQSLCLARFSIYG